MTDDILSTREIEIQIGSWTLIPGSGGVYEFSVNGELLFSKKAQGRHAEPGEIRRLLEAHIAALQAAQ
ncbi:MAG: Rdx family protein [Anaerolineae bacterium]|nr:Rdx family protein [Anaerolineae bacterium]